MEIATCSRIPEAAAKLRERFGVAASYHDVWGCYGAGIIRVVRKGSAIYVPDDQLPVIAEALQRRALRARDRRQSA